MLRALFSQAGFKAPSRARLSAPVRIASHEFARVVGVSSEFTRNLFQHANEDQKGRYIHPDEEKYADSFMGKESQRRADFLTGRVALRIALDSMSSANSLALHGALLPCDNNGLNGKGGPPVLPKGFLGSVSHIDGIAVGLAIKTHKATSNLVCDPLQDARVIGVGVDIALQRSPGRHKPSGDVDFHLKLARRIMTERERIEWGGFYDMGSSCLAMQMFSIKEAIYKSISMHCSHRRVGFQEVEVLPSNKTECLSSNIFDNQVILSGVPELQSLSDGVVCEALSVPWEPEGRPSPYFLSLAALYVK
jgi:4'-phosphopantetheinyl transferase EntD